MEEIKPTIAEFLNMPEPVISADYASRRLLLISLKSLVKAIDALTSTMSISSDEDFDDLSKLVDDIAYHTSDVDDAISLIDDIDHLEDVIGNWMSYVECELSKEDSEELNQERVMNKLKNPV